LLSSAAESVDLFLAPSRFAARMHQERGFTRPMAHLAPFAVRNDDDWRVPGRRPHDRPYFLFVGRLEPVKGIDTLVRVWDRLEDADLVIVGDGSERTRLEAAAARNPRIVVRGPVPHGELGPYFVHALACLVPSVTYEVAPMVVLEAFSRKTPVIARDLGGAPECVIDSGGGLLFQTEEELLGVLGRVAGNARLREELAENGYRQFLRLWTEDAHLSAFVGMLEEVARRKFGRVSWQLDTPDAGSSPIPERHFAQL
jgi:glycosyltransferase involved in cell wall biosynthesis